jgi:hypothetical protein
MGIGKINDHNWIRGHFGLGGSDGAILWNGRTAHKCLVVMVTISKDYQIWSFVPQSINHLNPILGTFWQDGM